MTVILGLIRMSIFWCLIFVTTCFFTLLGALSLLTFSFSIRYKVITIWSNLFILLAKYLLNITYDIQGIENLPSTPAVAAPNHQSAWETLFMQCLLPPQSWVLKRQLLWIPIFGWGLALLRPIAIERKKGKSAGVQVIEHGTKRLKQGLWVVIFPEGTRVGIDEKKSFSRSAALLASSADVPLVPIAHNAGTVWHSGSFIKGPGKITIVIGKPIEKMETRQMTDALQDWIYNQLNAIKHPD